MIKNATVGAFFASTETLQILAVAFSLLILLLHALLATIVFRHPRLWALRLLFFAVGAFFPALIVQGSPVNNDQLLALLVYVTILLGLLFWRRPSYRKVSLLACFCALALLTKVSALAATASCVLLITLRPSLAIRARASYLAVFGAIVLIIAGPFFLSRFFFSEQKHLVGNIESVHSGLRVPTTAKDLLTFNPLKMLDHPYNHPFDDHERRYFPEYLFRSMFFGEFNFGEELHTQARYLLLFGLLVALVALASLAPRRRDIFFLPMFLISAFTIAQMFSARIHTPYAPIQDFRYCLFLAAPIAYFVTSAVRHTRTMCPVKLAVAWAWVLQAAAFFVVFCVKELS
jgi:hypothetical protein